jgi:hypothetical protein
MTRSTVEGRVSWKKQRSCVDLAPKVKRKSGKKTGQTTTVKDTITTTPPSWKHLDLSFPATNKIKKKTNTNINHHSLSRLGEQKLHSPKKVGRKSSLH